MKTKGKTQIYLSRLLGKASRALHLIPPSLVMYSVEVADSDGCHVSGYNSKSNSWVRNAMNWMAMFALLMPDAGSGTAVFGDGYLNIKNISGVIDDGWFAGTRRWSNTANRQDYHTFQGTTAGTDGGIIVGSSSETESFEAYNLGSQILHGTSAGQLSYNAGSLVSVSWDSVASKWVSVGQRTFTNNGSSAVTVREIGYKKYITSQASQTIYEAQTILMIRDVLPEEKVVNPGQTLTVTFTIEFPY